jgi:allantoinase
MDLVVHAQRALVAGQFRPAFIGIRAGRIAAISASSIEGPLVVLAADEVLLPGIVDTHVHVNEPGRTEWEGFASATAAAAAGGVTTIIDMPLNSIPATTTADALRIKRAVAVDQVRVDTGFWGGAVPENLGALQQLHDAGVFGFKAFLAPSGVDEFGHLDASQLEAALDEIAALDSVLIVHAEDPGVLDQNANAGGTDYHAFVQSRPDEAEVTAIGRVIAGVRRTGARAHILHLSSAAALGELRAARAEGLPITVETCPHYLTFCAEEIPDGATAFKCAPPIRGRAEREALWEALRSREIDLIASDHSPCLPDMKKLEAGDFRAAWGGISSLQVSLPAVWSAARERGFSVSHLAAWMCAAPARLAGIADRKGSIAAGRDADLVIWEPEIRSTILTSTLQHRHKVTPYIGRTPFGVIRFTLLRGETVYDGGAFLDRPIGRPILRGGR